MHDFTFGTLYLSLNLRLKIANGGLRDEKKF